MAFGAHYKGDVSEITMGHETGIYLEHNEPLVFTATTTAGDDYTTITFTGTGSANSIGAGDVLKVPIGMLIGCKMTFHGTGGNFSPYYYDSINGTIFSIVDHELTGGDTTIKIVPALSAGSKASGSSEVLFIHSTGLPTIDISGFSASSSAKASVEKSLIDQFVGLASFMKLPDTTVDLHRYHVVGMGRQMSLQQTGKVHHQGGALEIPMHNAKWLYYALGREVVDYNNCGGGGHSGFVSLPSAISPGQVYVDVGGSSSVPKFGSTNVSVGDYILVKDTTQVPVIQYRGASLGNSGNIFWPPASAAGLSADSDEFEFAESSECRRVIGYEELTSTTFRLFVEHPFQFAHTTSDTITSRNYTGVTAPEISTGRVKNSVRKLIFTGETIPSFSLEHSIRNRDVGSYNSETGDGVNTPGGTTDSKQLTRVFRGCKINEWEISSTVDAELKFRATFDALSCYTDTGRLESANAGDRYIAHRMFQNTGETDTNRKIAGIASGEEKPFMFYNGTIEAFGQSIGFISSFELRGKTGVELFHTIQSNPVGEDVQSSTGLSTKQVPYGGTRNASIIREGREQLDMEIDVVLTDPNLFHQLRSHNETSSGVDASTNKQIKLHFTKPYSGTIDSDYTVPSIRIILDDYFITEAPIPMPDDKGLLHSKIMLQPQSIKVIAEDTVYHN
jgi:hypothetical protein